MRLGWLVTHPRTISSLFALGLEPLEQLPSVAVEDLHLAPGLLGEGVVGGLLAVMARRVHHHLRPLGAAGERGHQPEPRQSQDHRTGASHRVVLLPRGRSPPGGGVARLRAVTLYSTRSPNAKY